MVERVMFAAAETRSFARAELALEKIGGVAVSANTVQRVVGDVGLELAARRDADPNGAGGLAQRPEAPPELAVVECDGGRARTREPGYGRGVHLSGEEWRETKNGDVLGKQSPANEVSRVPTSGLPVTTAWMESLVKEVNYRVKGTEMFWNNPTGAEAILQVRAAALSDDDRLSKYLHARPGRPFTRRPKSPKSPAEICTS